MIARKCLNPECPNPDVEIRRTNKLFCDLKCKNRYTYLTKLFLNPYEIEMAKHRNNNNTILKFLLNNGHSKIGVLELTTLGFYFPACFGSTRNYNTYEVFRFNDIEIYQDSNSNIHLSKINNDDTIC